MLSKQSSQIQPQTDLFRPLLLDFIDTTHHLVVLSQQINWKVIEDGLAHRYSKFGAPAKPIRLMAGLLILKQMFNKSDVVIVEEWRQNPYHQFLKARLIFNGAFHVIRRIWFISANELKKLV